jgi:hypothetical protein
MDMGTPSKPVKLRTDNVCRVLDAVRQAFERNDVPLEGRSLAFITPAGVTCIISVTQDRPIWRWADVRVEPNPWPRSRILYGEGEGKEIWFDAETEEAALAAWSAMDSDPDQCDPDHKDCLILASPQFMGVLREALRALDKKWHKPADAEPPSEEGEA